MNQLVSLVDRVQVDFADHTLVANQTALPDQLSAFPPELAIEAHLMVDQPTSYLAKLKELGASRILVHLESPVDLAEVIRQIKEHDMTVGLALNPETAIEELEPYIQEAELVQIMSIQPGWGNQVFLPESFGRIEQMKRRYPQVPIAVDGGVRLTNARPIMAAGAEYLVVGKGGFAAEADMVTSIRQWQDTLGQPGS